MVEKIKKTVKNQTLDNISQLQDIIKLAKDQKIARLKVGNIELEFHPNAFKTQLIPPIKSAIDLKRAQDKRKKEKEDDLYYSADR